MGRRDREKGKRGRGRLLRSRGGGVLGADGELGLLGLRVNIKKTEGSFPKIAIGGTWPPRFSPRCLKIGWRA